MGKLSMTDDELKTRIRNGTPIKILAELNGVSDQAIRNFMKKNGISRPERECQDLKDSRTMSKADLSVLEIIQNHQKNIQERISDHERMIGELRKCLESWKKAEEAFTKCD